MDVSPEKQNIDRVFSNTAYYIDFYQRDYRWTDEPVRRLLDDILFRFKEQYARSSDLDPGEETITTYPWYFLNTYVTNVVGGKTYVVDGQQRLTTLSLILIKLRHLANLHSSGLDDWINGKIAGQTGFERKFLMNHVNHKTTQEALFDGVDPKGIDTESGITARNMVKNFQAISGFLDRELSDKHCFETFVFYFLRRLVLINLTVEQTDVAMVFEVINDRGIRLRPYEILKGKLLGQIDKSELDRDGYHVLWEDRARKINDFRENELDTFFRFYLKAKFADSRDRGQRFDGEYHREMFMVDMDERLGLLHSPTNVKTFLKGDFTYYTNLYVKLRHAYAQDQAEFQAIFFSALLGLEAPFHLVLSACLRNDPDENQKIETTGHEIDRYYSLLQLQNAYDSNEFADSLYRISAKIRHAPADTFRAVFDAELRAMIAARRNVDIHDAEPLSYAAFRQSGINLNIRFKRYFFARIDEFLAENMNLNPKQHIAPLVSNSGRVNGFHVEHILSRNEGNLELFEGDEERFEQERNRLGAILLLKGLDNISSSNEPYKEKLKTYANTLYWNETLRADSYKSKLDMTAFKKRYDLELEPLHSFGPEEVEARHRLLYRLVGIIWS